MFASLKRITAERKLARAESTAQFKAKIAAINTKSAADKQAIADAHAQNKATLKARMAANNAEFKAKILATKSN